MQELFVYYRIRAGDAIAALAAVTSIQNQLRQRHPLLNARLLWRPEVQGGAQTWMEIYAMNSPQSEGGITEALQREIGDMAEQMAPYIDGQRHVEAFVPSH